MMSRIPLAAATALAALALAGCAADSGDTASSASAAPSVTTSTSASGAPASGSPGAGGSTQANPGGSSAGTPVGDSLLVFTRQGGIAGMNDRLVLKADGGYTVQTKSGTRNGKLTDQELATVKSTLAAVDFNKMPSVNTGGNVADGFKYSVTYAGREIVAEDGAIPPALQPVIGALSALLSK